MSEESRLRLVVPGRRLILSLAVVCVAAMMLSVLATGPLAPFLSRNLDAPASSYFLAHEPAAASVLRLLGSLGSPAIAATIVVALATIIGVRTRRWAPLCAAAAALLGAVVITCAVRGATARSSEYGPRRGFPSGHAVTAASVFGTLALLAVASRLPRRWKVLAVSLAVAAPIVVAWSRLVLLDHVPSDVIGGMLIGSAWAVAVVRAIPLHAQRGQSMVR